MCDSCYTVDGSSCQCDPCLVNQGSNWCTVCSHHGSGPGVPAETESPEAAEAAEYSGGEDAWGESSTPSEEY